MTGKLEEAARKLLPPGAYDFYVAGSGEGISAEEAAGAWRSYRFLPRVLRDVSGVDTSVELLGSSLATPVLAAPTAFHTMAHPEGEVATAAGVADAGSLMVVSSRSTRQVEDVAVAAGQAPWWFQVYVLRDRTNTMRQVGRAVSAGARVLVLTVDAPYVAAKPRLRLPLPLPADDELARTVGLDSRTAGWEQDPSIGLETIDWLRRESGLQVVVKGVLRADDARACVDAGAVGVIVSNHGGRQFDRAVPPASALPAVVDAIDDAVPVLVDGGIRNGTDVLTALALGARAVLVGRPVLWALAAGGANGVRELLDGYRAELAEAMALAGAATVGDINRELLAEEPWVPSVGGPRSRPGRGSGQGRADRRSL
ncbi:hypothetical protein XF35_24805 [Streptomyces platensis subsp. clarensis]|nr:hypothetical protein [Streptomyces platensis subsp. clarensis]